MMEEDLNKRRLMDIKEADEIRKYAKILSKKRYAKKNLKRLSNLSG